MRRDDSVPVDVLEPVEVGRPVAQAGVAEAVALAVRRGSEPRNEIRREPHPGPVHRKPPVEMEAQVVQLRPRHPLHQHRRVETRRGERRQPHRRRRRDVLIRPDVPGGAVVPRLAVDVVREGEALAGVEGVRAGLEVQVRGTRRGRDELVGNRLVDEVAGATKVVRTAVLGDAIVVGEAAPAVHLEVGGERRPQGVDHREDVRGRGPAVALKLDPLAPVGDPARAEDRAVLHRHVRGADLDAVLVEVVDDGVPDLLVAAAGVGVDADSGAKVARCGRQIVDDQIPQQRVVAVGRGDKGDGPGTSLVVAVDFEKLDPGVALVDL